MIRIHTGLTIVSLCSLIGAALLVGGAVGVAGWSPASAAAAWSSAEDDPPAGPPDAGKADDPSDSPSGGGVEPPDDLPAPVREQWGEPAEESGGDPDAEDAEESETIEYDADEDDGPPRRVIIEVSRQRTEMGYVEFEDDEVIVVRTLDDEVESFTKRRVRRVTELYHPEPGQRARLLLQTGREQQGILLEDDFEYVVLEIRGIPTRFPREAVSRVTLEPTFEELYEHFKATIQPDNTDARIAFARWLFDHEQYELAKEEIRDVRRRTNDSEARRLETLIDAQLALEERAREREEQQSRAGDDPDRERDRDDRRIPEGPTRLLTSDEVNLIRVYEIDFDRPPKVSVRPETIQRLVERYGTDSRIPSGAAERTAMFREDAVEIVRLMFDLRARDLYPEVQVNSEPYALNLFRQRVHNAWLVQNCSTSRCHGGPDAGRLQLHNRNFQDSRVWMTNLLILEETELDPQWPLINYDEPRMSQIIQYALPRSEARLPHPDVPGWRPVFRRSNQRLLDDTIRWIDSMMTPRPSYPIDFSPGGAADGDAPEPGQGRDDQPGDGGEPVPSDDPWRRDLWDEEETDDPDDGEDGRSDSDSD